MIRERTSLNLLIGLLLSAMAHLSLVMWNPPFSLQTPARQPPSEVEVQLREWPVPPPPPTETLKPEAPPPSEPPPTSAAKPSLPPDVGVLREAVSAAVRTEPPVTQAPDQQPPLPPFASQTEPIRLPPAWRDSLQPDLRIAELPPLPDLPQPERAPTEPNALPTLPALERAARHEEPAARPAIVALPTPGIMSSIQGPAAERQVIFQPAPPSVTVDTESELELRFWILPNGVVGRVVPVKKTDPRLEALAINYLRHWRFTPLPSGGPQDEQWGIIPFKFRIR